jgi:hypothetical protein
VEIESKDNVEEWEGEEDPYREKEDAREEKLKRVRRGQKTEGCQWSRKRP